MEGRGGEGRVEGGVWRGEGGGRCVGRGDVTEEVHVTCTHSLVVQGVGAEKKL